MTRKKALVTGGSGFVGRHMVKALEKRGFDVCNIDVVNGVDAIDYFRNWYSGDWYQLLVHCAYQVGGRVGIDGRNNNFAHNLRLDSAMFEWAFRTNQDAVMYFSSCAAYPSVYQTEYMLQPIDEDLLSWEAFYDDDPLRPFDNYGWTKQTGERLAKHYSDMGLRVHVLRPFSGYGEDQSLDYPFPAIVKRAKDDDLTVWGPRGQTRDWIHIDDIIEGALAVYENDDRRPVNLCTGVGTEMGELMKIVYGEVTGEGYCAHEPKINYLIDKPTGALYRVGDPSRMNEHYTAKISLEEGVKRAIGRI